MSEVKWAVTTGKQEGVTELRATFSASGLRRAQVLIKVAAEGVPPDPRYARLYRGETLSDPQFVISMNGTAGMSFDEYREMVKQIDAAVERNVKQTVKLALG